MRRQRVASGFLCLAFLCGCRNDSESQAAAAAASAQRARDEAAAQASAAVASARGLAAAVEGQGQTSLTGSVHSVGGGLGTWDIVLGECHSGESSGFFGVDFYAEATKELRLRYVHDEAKGEIVKVVDPSKKDLMLVLDRNEKCSVLEGSLEKTNFSTSTPKGKIRHLNGRVKFDCKLAGGKGQIRGEAIFSHCH